MNNFIATGGDGFTAFTAGTDTLVGMSDLDALVAYFKAGSPVTPGLQNRINLLP
jgi:5'-nucleotidase